MIIHSIIYPVSITKALLRKGLHGALWIESKVVARSVSVR